MTSSRWTGRKGWREGGGGIKWSKFRRKWMVTEGGGGWGGVGGGEDPQKLDVHSYN